jgi:exopolysaccharide biosynthesis predicted pyruvyltransferase EpsI
MAAKSLHDKQTLSVGDILAWRRRHPIEWARASQDKSRCAAAAATSRTSTTTSNHAKQSTSDRELRNKLPANRAGDCHTNCAPNKPHDGHSDELKLRPNTNTADDDQRLVICQRFDRATSRRPSCCLWRSPIKAATTSRSVAVRHTQRLHTNILSPLIAIALIFAGKSHRRNNKCPERACQPLQMLVVCSSKVCQGSSWGCERGHRKPERRRA